MTFQKILFDSFLDNWNKPAVTSYSSGLTLAYADLAARIVRVINLLERLDVKPGTHIAVVGHNSIDWITNYMASFFHGAVTITVNLTDNLDDLLSLTAIADTEILFIDPELMSQDPDFSTMPKLKLVISQDSLTRLHYRSEAYSDAQLILDDMDFYFASRYPSGFQVSDLFVPDVRPDTPTAIFFTAGTTGAPKPVLLSSDSIEGSIIFGLKRALFPMSSNVITSTSVGNIWGTIFNIIVPLASGAHITVFDDLNKPMSLIEAFKVVKPQRVFLSPSQLRAIYKLIDNSYRNSRHYKLFKVLPFNSYLLGRGLRRVFNRAMGGKCREVIVGTSYIGRKLKSKLHSAGINFTLSYGMVETGGLTCYTPSGDFVPTTSGRPIPNMVKCRIRPLDLKGLPENAGILEVSGMLVMQEYYNDPEATRLAFTKDRWFSTRDIATIDAHGEVSILARIDTIITRPEGIIVPERLESYILNSSGIKQAVLVDRDDVLTLIAYVPPTLDAESTTKNAIEAFNKIAPPYMHIKDYEISPTPLESTFKGTVARYKYL